MNEQNDLEPIDLSDEMDGAAVTMATPRRFPWVAALMSIVVIASLVALASSDGAGTEKAATAPGEVVEGAGTSSAAGSGGTGGPWGGALGGGDEAGPWGPPNSLEPQLRRTTDDGIAIRTFVPKNLPACDEPMGAWCPPVECQGGPGVVLELSTAAIAGMASGYRSPSVLDLGFTSGGAGVLGLPEGAPVMWGTAVVPGGATSVRLEVDGAVDVAPVRDGWAVVAVPTSVDRFTGDPTTEPDSAFAGIELVALDAAGKEVDRAPMWEVPIFGPLPSECEPPAPPLPPAGEQPSNHDGAWQGVREAYRIAFDGEVDRAAKLAVIDDPSGLESAFAQARQNFESQTRALQVEIIDLVFTSPTEAAVQFRLTYSGSSLGNKLGHAVLVDGKWKVTRSTMCEVLELANVTCP